MVNFGHGFIRDFSIFGHGLHKGFFLKANFGHGLHKGFFH